MTRIHIELKVRISEEEWLHIVINSSGPDTALCFAARTAGKGHYIKSPPKGWSIRHDSAGEAYENQPEHYHCTRDSDGKIIVITQSGHGSHKTKTGDEIPRKLGDYLIGKLKIPVHVVNGRHLIRFETNWPWYRSGYSPLFPEILEDLLNHWSVVSVANDDDLRDTD